MLRHRILVVCSLWFCTLTADAQQGQPAGTDQYGDPLPAGAIARLGSTRFRHDHAIVFAGFLPDGKSVVSVSEDGGIRVSEFPSGKVIRQLEALSGAAAFAISATLSPDGKHLTVFCDDGFMRIWDWNKSKELGKVATPGKTAKAAKNTNSPFTSSLAKALAKSPVPGPVYSPDGKTLLLFGGSRVMQLVDLPNGKEIGACQGHTDSLTSVLFSADGKHIVTKDSKATHAWEAGTGKNLGAVPLILPPNPGSPIIVSPDGKYGLSVARFVTPAKAKAAKAREAVLFDTATGDTIVTLELEAETTPIHRKPIIFSPDSKMLAVNSGTAQQKIHIYEIPSGKLLRALDAGPGNAGGKGGGGFGPGGGGFGPGGGGGFASATAQKMLFSPDGKLVAFQYNYAAPILVLDATTGKQIASLPHAEDRDTLTGVFSPDGRCLALEKNDGTVTLYELATGQSRFSYGGPLPLGLADVADLLGGAGNTDKSRANPAISPDGKLLALAGIGGSIHIWDILTGKEITTLKGHKVAVNALAFAPNSKALASGSDDTTALIWDMTKITRPALPAKALTAEELEQLWTVLAGDDANRAFTAIGNLAAAPKETVAWIKEKVKPAAPLDMKHIAELLKQLDDNQFKVRAKATIELLKIGEHVLPVIEKALTGDLSPESRLRLEELRTKMTAMVVQGDRLRILRAVEVLEFIGTKEARQVLQALADGASGALVTTSAQAALKR